MVAPDPIPDHINAALTAHPDWKRTKAAASTPPAAKPAPATARTLPEAVAELSNVKKLRELAKRLDIDLGDARKRVDVEAAIAASDRSDAELVAVAEAIDQE
jgi:hypothetical protein